MLKIKGFINFPAVTDNALNAVAKFGELSQYGRTFAREVLEYNDSRWPDVEMVALHCRDTVTGVRTAPSTEFTYKTLEIMQWVYQTGITNPTTMTTNDFLVNMLNMFQGQITTLNCGPLVTDGIRRLPEWVSWKQESNTDNAIKFWLVNEAFERDFDEYEIVISPPIGLVDTFFQSTQQVQNALALVTPVKTMENIHTAKAKRPETILRAEVLPYTNQTMGAGNFINTTWYAIIYGPAGDSTDNIKRAIIDYIQSNSSADVNAWKIVFPDIFRTTEMFILPRWDLISIPFRQTVNGLYSPIARANHTLDWTKARLDFLSAAHINANMEMTHHKYRSIGLVTVGGTDNKDAKYRLTDYVGDYIAESSMAEDFNRQSQPTKDWTIMMEELLILAEEIDEFSTLPANVRRSTRANILFVGKKHAGVEWLVATKKSLVTP